MHSVAEVMSPEFARSWHEAVAIVQEAASQLQPGVALPGPSDLFFDENGGLSLGFGDESAGSTVAGLAGLLDQLLAGVEAPATLRDLVRENSGSEPAHASVASFSTALSFFERPNRANDLRAVAGRLRGFREKSSPELEFERLREKVAHGPETKEPDKPGPPKPRKAVQRRQQAVAAAVVGVLTLGTLGFRSGVHRGLGSFVGQAEGGIQSVVSAGLEAFGVSKAPSSNPASGNGKGPDQPVEAERAGTSGSSPQRASRSDRQRAVSDPARRADLQARTRSAATADAAASSRPAPVAPLPPGPAAALPVTPAGPPLSPPGAVGGAPTAAKTVFSKEDEGVVAPVMVRPQLPREPAPGDDTGIFDLLIDEQGRVAQVKLISPTRGYHDRMLVAAAKAWIFRPATLNGRPVSYRVQIPIILTGMPGR